MSSGKPDDRKRGGAPPGDSGDSDGGELFRAEMEGVRKARPVNRVEHDKPRPAPLPVKRLEDDKLVVAEMLSDEGSWQDFNETGNGESYLREGLPRDVLRRLKRGDWAVQDEVDLHGITVETARALVGELLQRARRHGLRCVKIIHGKGLRSQGGEAILRAKVRKGLMMRDDVLAYADARPGDGGSGAVVVLLKG